MNKTIKNMVSIAEQNGLFTNDVWKIKNQNGYICVYHHSMLILVLNNLNIEYVYCQSKYDFNVIKYILDIYHIDYETIDYVNRTREFYLRISNDITWYYSKGVNRMMLNYKNDCYTWNEEEIFDYNQKMIKKYDKLA